MWINKAGIGNWGISYGNFTQIGKHLSNPKNYHY